MSFKVTAKMVNEFWNDLVNAKNREGTNIFHDYQETIQKFVDQHKLAPASAVEDVELTDVQALDLFAYISAAKGGCEGKAAAETLRSLGFRIVRDANAVAADDAAKREAMDAVIEKLTSRINALEINQGDTKKMNAELMKRVDKVGTDCQAVKNEVTRAANRAIQIKNRVEALEASKVEPETKAVGRTFTEEDVRTAMKHAVDADGRSVTAVAFTFSFAELLGIDPEAIKQTECDDD